LTADHLGSTRVVTDGSGTVVARHDYLPFGEEIVSSNRTLALFYTSDNLAEKFTGKERMRKRASISLGSATCRLRKV
jgi:uncharacterized protein RhaS with RHS repeats